MENRERAGHGTQDYASLLIHRGNGHIAEIEAALREVDFIDSDSNNDPRLVSRLVPLEMQRNANAWLVIYSPQDAVSDGGVHDALVIPFPDRDIRVSRNNPPALGLHARRLLEKIRGLTTTTWKPVIGVVSLMDSITVPEIRTPRFQLIHSDDSLFEADPRTGVALPKPANPTNDDLDAVDIQAAFSDAIRDVGALKAQEALLQLDESDASDVEQHAESMASKAAKINNRLAQQILQSGGKRVVPPIVRKYRKIIDRATRRYLISAATVAAYVKANPEVAHDFEYSLPGSGVCKAMEREIRNCMEQYLHKDRRDISLGEVENTLKTTRAVRVRLRSEFDASLHTYLLGQETTDLPEQLNKIRRRRNEVAHSDPVSKTKFDELWGWCLDPESSPGESTLGKILEWKRQQQAHSNVE